MAFASDMMKGGTSAGQALGLNGQANVAITAGTSVATRTIISSKHNAPY